MAFSLYLLPNLPVFQRWTLPPSISHRLFLYAYIAARFSQACVPVAVVIAAGLLLCWFLLYQVSLYALHASAFIFICLFPSFVGRLPLQQRDIAPLFVLLVSIHHCWPFAATCKTRVVVALRCTKPIQWCFHRCFLVGHVWHSKMLTALCGQ